MKDNLKLVLGTVAVIALVAIAALLTAEAVDDSDEHDVTQEPIALANEDTANSPDGDIEEVERTAQLDNGQVVDADDVPLSRTELDRAEAAALRIAGGGVVTDIDRSDDLNEAYEVEVVGDTGELDIALNDRFERVPNVHYDN